MSESAGARSGERRRSTAPRWRPMTWRRSWRRCRSGASTCTAIHTAVTSRRSLRCGTRSGCAHWCSMEPILWTVPTTPGIRITRPRCATSSTAPASAPLPAGRSREARSSTSRPRSSCCAPGHSAPRCVMAAGDSCGSPPERASWRSSCSAARRPRRVCASWMRRRALSATGTGCRCSD